MLDLARRVGMICSGIVLVASTVFAEGQKSIRSITTINASQVYSTNPLKSYNPANDVEDYAADKKFKTEWYLASQDYGKTSFEVKFKINVKNDISAGLVLNYRF